MRNTAGNRRHSDTLTAPDASTIHRPPELAPRERCAIDLRTLVAAGIVSREAAATWTTTALMFADPELSRRLPNPSHRQIAAVAGCTARSVGSHLRELEGAGLLIVLRDRVRSGPDGCWRHHNRYRIANWRIAKLARTYPSRLAMAARRARGAAARLALRGNGLPLKPKSENQRAGAHRAGAAPPGPVAARAGPAPPCGPCDGLGMVETTAHRPSGPITAWAPCPYCRPGVKP